jgi:sarcosine oxidase subunit alpha
MMLWQALLTAGERFGVMPFGTEAMHVLRAEKGYIMVGQETDGTVTPLDLGMERAISTRKDFLGKRSLSRADMTKPDRKQLVGLLTEDPAEVLPEGAHIVAEPQDKLPPKALGHVTSSYASPTLGRSIALALLRGGRGLLGRQVFVPREAGGRAAATVVDPVFYDPKGARLHG